MSGNLIGGVIGGVIGLAFGNPQAGWLVGSSIGGLFNSRKGGGGPDMTDLRPQTSEYGRPIPIVYGTMAIGGNVIWSSDLIKVSEGSDGGKGGGSAPSAARYAANFAVLLCESSGNITLGRIWAGPDKRLIWDGSTFESGALHFYNGAEDQMPDPLIESYMGAGNVPAYRGYAYIVIEMFDVSAHDGHRIPFLTVEVGNVQTIHLGYVWPHNAWLDSGNVVVKHGPGQGGLLVASNSSHNMVANVQFAINQDNANNFYDADRDILVTYRATNFVFEQPATSGAPLLTHAIDTTGKPADLSPFSGDCLYYGGKYLFSVYKTGSSNEFGIYVIDPASWATLSILRFPGMDANVTWMAAPRAGAGWVYALSAANVWKLPLDGSAPVLLGTMPAGGAFDTPIFGVDQSTGWLFTTTDPVTSSTSRTFAVYDGASGTKVKEEALVLDGPGFFPTCFLSVPRAGELSAMYLMGGTNAFTDGYLRFDSTGTFLGYLQGATRTPSINGDPIIQTGLYDSARDVIMVFRDAYGFAIVAETSSGGAPETLPVNTWHLGESSLNPTPVQLADVVTDLSVRAGLRPDQVDVSDLTDQVDGYVLANQVSVKDAISALMPAYYFDAVEDQGVLRFPKRGGAIVVQIPQDDLGAHDQSEEVLDLYETTRGMDEELPHTFSVNYILEATKYSPATKYARRLIGYSGDEARMDMPMVFSDLKATQIAAVNLHDQWVSRITYKFSLGRKYAYLMPTDIVGLPGQNGEGYTARITKVTQKDNGVLEFEAVQDDSDTYIPHVIVEETPPPDDVVNIPVLTVLELM